MAVTFDVDGVPVDDVAGAGFVEQLVDDVAAAQGAGVLRGRRDGLFDFGVGDEALHGSGGFQAVEEAGVRADVVVLQVEALENIVLPGDACLIDVLLVEHLLGGPVEAIRGAKGIGLQVVQGALPLFQNHVGLSIATAEVALRRFEVTPLEVDGGDRLAVAHPHLPLHRRVAGDGAQGLQRIGDFDIVGNGALFDQVEDQARRADLEHCRVLAHIALAEEDMQTVQVAVGVVGVPFGIDDGAVEPDAARDRFDDMVGALGELEIDRIVDLHPVEVGDPDVVHFMLAERHDVVFAAGARETVAPYPSDARVDLPGDQEGQQIGERIGEEAVFDLDQIVLMAAEGVAAEMIDAVVVKTDRIVEFQFGNQLGEQNAPGAVVSHKIQQVTALRGRVLLMTADGIDVETSAVLQESPGPGRFKGVIAGMQVDHPEFTIIKGIVLDALDHLLRRSD